MVNFLSATDFREIGAMLLKEGVWPPKLCTGIFGENEQSSSLRLLSEHNCIIIVTMTTYDEQGPIPFASGWR